MKTTRRTKETATGVTMLVAIGWLGGLAGVLGANTPRLALGQTISLVATYPGGSNSAVYGVNSNGTAAAGYSNNAGGTDTGMRWLNPGGSLSMGFLPGGGLNSYTQAIDGSGTILAGYGDSAGNTRAFRATTMAGFTVLPLIPGTFFAQAFGLSTSGARVAGTSGVGGVHFAFLWDSGSPGIVTNLGVVSGQSTSDGLAISGDGTTVTGFSGALPMRWTAAGGMVGLGAGLPGQTSARGEGINTSGSVITGRYNTGSELGFRWTAGTGMVALPASPGGTLALRPRAVSGDGNVIIGQVVDGVAGFTAFVWTPTLGTQLLATHLAARAVNLAGWQLRDATAISADGSAMCGIGIFGGQSVGWVVSGLSCPTLTSGISGFMPAVCIGNSATLSVNYSAAPGTTPFFRWWRNGVLISNGLQPSGSTASGATTNVLSFANTQLADAGTYQVGISAQGACETLSATFNFAGPAFITPVAQPGNTTVCPGQSASLFAAGSSVATVSYAWQVLNGPNWNFVADGPTGNGSTRIGSATSTFSYLNAQPADSGQYRCLMFISGCGTSSWAISNPATLTVIANTSVLVDPAPQTVCPGASFVFFTVVAAPVGQGFTYQWQRHQPPFPNVYVNISDGPSGFGGTLSGTTTSFLGISTPLGGDFDRYRCVATGPCGFAATSNNALLSATPNPVVTSGPTQTGGCQGGTASLAVMATPAGSTYQWQQYIGPCILCYQNVSNGPTGNGGAFSGAQSPTLTITGFDLFDTFLPYRCLVTSPCGGTPGASPDVQFTYLEPPFYQTQPVGGKVCPNGTKTMTIALAPGNYGTLSYQWWRYTNAGPIFAPVFDGTYVTGSIASGAATPSITISNFQPGDTGQYYCKAMGDCGMTFSSVVNLTHCPPDFNCDGLTNVQDIFDFLAAWFAGNPAANFNGIGGIDVADIFAFLAAWFAGC